LVFDGHTVCLCGLKVETDPKRLCYELDPDQVLSLLMGYMCYRIVVGRKDKQV